MSICPMTNARMCGSNVAHLGRPSRLDIAREVNSSQRCPARGCPSRWTHSCRHSYSSRWWNGSGSRERTVRITQNSSPTGSSMTTHETSSWPLSMRFAPNGDRAALLYRELSRQISTGATTRIVTYATFAKVPSHSLRSRPEVAAPGLPALRKRRCHRSVISAAHGFEHRGTHVGGGRSNEDTGGAERLDLRLCRSLAT